MFSLAPVVTPSVTVDGRTGRPRYIRVGGLRLAVTQIESVRDETAAYPAASGPRTVFVVCAAGRRFRLTHRLRERCWDVEDLGARRPGLAHAA